MKILSISTDRSIFKNGSSARIRIAEYGGLFEELHVIIFTKKWGGFKKEQISSNVWIYSTNSWTRWLYINNATRIATNIIKISNFRKNKDVVSVQDPFETGLVGLKLKKIFKLALHVQIHTDFLSPYFAKHSFINRVRVAIARRVLTKADAVRAVSWRIKRSLEEQKITTAPTMVVPIFVDIRAISGAETKENSLRVDLLKKYPQFNFIILTASRLAPEKNIPLAFEMMKKLIKIYPGVGLVVVGEGEEKGRLVSLATRLGISQNVIFEPWQKDIISYYKSANVFLSTSKYEGYGLSMVEAVAARCPTVSTDAGVAPDLLRSGEVSFVCSVNDSGCLFEKVKMLILDTPLRGRFVHEAFDRLHKITFGSKEEYLNKYKESVESAVQGVAQEIQ